MSTTVTPTVSDPRQDNRLGIRRVAALSRANTVLMTRNKLTLVYSFLMPLLPLVLLASARGDVAVGTTVASSMMMLVLLFPVFYNVLSLVVTRRDELVLKRLRTGQTRDLELVTSIAIPGVGVALAVSVVGVGIGAAFGLPLPANLLLYVVGVLAGCVLFTALALWTAAWTRTAEAAQITSMPIIALAVVGSLVDVLPARVADVVAYTPIAAIDTLVEVSWFGRLDGDPVSFAATWSEAGQPLLILVAWTAVAVEIARRSMRWEPRV